MNPIGNESLQSVRQLTLNSPASGASPADPGDGSVSLPDPAAVFSQGVSGDLGAELAALALKAGQKERDVAQQARDLFEGAMSRQEDAAVAAMRQKADDIQSGAVASGLFTIGEGAMQMSQGMDAFNATTAQRSGDPSGAAGWKLQEQCDQGLGIVLKGSGTLVAGIFQAAAERDESVVAQSRSAADHAKTAAEDMHDAAKNADGFVRAAIDFYREYSSSQNHSLLAALHRS